MVVVPKLSRERWVRSALETQETVYSPMLQPSFSCVKTVLVLQQHRNAGLQALSTLSKDKAKHSSPAKPPCLATYSQ